MNAPTFQLVDEYLTGLFAHEDKALRFARDASHAAGLPDIAVSATEGKFLHVLARACNAGRILEIGTLGAYSTIWLGRALAAGGSLVTIEVDSHHADVARNNLARAGLHHVVDVRVGAALDVLPTLQGTQPFDFVFIDADKETYAEYFDWAVRLSRPGALIVADNVVRKGLVLNDDAQDARAAGARRFNAVLAADRRVAATALQTVGAKGHDGMAIAVVLPAQSEVMMNSGAPSNS